MHRTLLLGLILSAWPLTHTLAQIHKPQPKRARLPTFSGPSDIFFRDAYAEALVGDRPKSSNVPVATTGDSGSDNGNSADGGYEWSKLVSAEILEDEVKALQQSVNETVTTPGKFSSGDYRTARREFSTLAMMFAVIGEYDGEVRWKTFAPTLRDAMAHTAGNAKVGTIQVYNEAKLRKTELTDLVRGAKLPIDQQANAQPDWSSVCDRPPLMKRLKTSYQQRLLPWLSSATEFRKHRDQLAHESAFIAVLAEVLTRDGMEDAGDETYEAYCTMLRDAAVAISKAARDNNYSAARAAKEGATKSCSKCHDEYRG